MSRLAPYAKAVAGGLAAGLAALGTALTDGAVSPAEWVAVASAFLAGTGIVAAAPANRQV
ncbi:hypothetical protein [Jiangella muralis]|uniref:hypothetical protein n=1 Tax=Jiangella muralis TaxID=702383 RepID=UPI00069EC7F6|nr:hypothetical protein [Jiangella muralis]